MPAILAGGGKVLVINDDPHPHELGLSERVVVIEFPSYEAAMSTFESDGYRSALAALAEGAERDVRITAGVD